MKRQEEGRRRTKRQEEGRRGMKRQEEGRRRTKRQEKERRGKEKINGYLFKNDGQLQLNDQTWHLKKLL